MGHLFEREFNNYIMMETSLEKECLGYWKSKMGVYVIISNLCDMLLASPGTSVPSERLFSKTGYLVSDRRNRLDAKRVEQITFLQEYLKLLASVFFLI